MRDPPPLDCAIAPTPSGPYAHSGRALDQSDWEKLSDHLNEVGRRASGFASVFGMAAVARAMGLLHDAGKVTDAYQQYIRGKGPSPDHSTAGAVIAYRHYEKKWGKLMAFAIAGHHAGLANGTGGGNLRPLMERINGTVGNPPIPAGIDLPHPAEVRKDLKPFDAFGKALLARMLFSCLVDADRLATEEFYAKLDGKEPDRDCPLTLANLHEALNRHLEGLTAEAARKAVEDPSLAPVTELRAEVLRTVRERAALDPGLFTLTVPTGGGKTLASLAFALDHAEAHGLRRVIHVIPFTSIVEQTADVFRTALGGEDAVLEHHSGFDPEKPPVESRNPGEAPGTDDEGRDGGMKARLAAQNWDRPVVVTTAVQFFESLFSNRPGRCRKLHAIARSVIVLDEAQTLPLKFLKPCLAALKELKKTYGCSIVLCTATPPAIQENQGFTGGLTDVRELAPDPERLYAELRRVRVTRCPEPLDVPALAERLAEDPQVLCIVNNRRHARDLFEAVRHQPGARLLTTALCGADRRRILAEIRQDLTEGRPVRLVATSLIEAGVDVSFPVVWRAMAGLDSVAQAAGRCNRHGELGREGGRVFVFTPADNPDHKPPVALKQFAGSAAAVIDDFDDPLGLEAIRAYFGEIYWKLDLAKALDGAVVGGRPGGIIEALDVRSDTLDFPFADIADAFRIIEDTQHPVIVVPKGHEAHVAKLLGDLAFARHGGGIARKLQPYTVQVPRKGWEAMWKAEVLAAVEPEKFGDQFIRLTNADLYDPVAGLRWDDPTFRAAESSFL